MTLAMLRRAGPLTLLVYVLRTGAAFLLGGPLALDLSAAVAQRMYGAKPAPGDAALLLEVVARRMPDALVWGGSVAVLYAALASIASVAWARALLRGESVRACFAHGLQRAPQALGTTAAFVIGYLALLAGGARLLALGLDRLPASAHAELALRSAWVLLALGGMWLLSTLYDLACVAQTSAAVPVARAFRHAWRALDARTLVLRALFALAIAGCFGCAELLGRNAAGALGANGVLLLQQWLVFASAVLRATWLAHALQRMQATNED